MTRNLLLFHQCGWHLDPSGWYKGFANYADWAADVESMWPYLLDIDMDVVLCVRCIGKLGPGRIPELPGREMHGDLQSLAQLKDRLGCKLMLYEGTRRNSFNFQREWGAWSSVAQRAKPDYIVFEGLNTRGPAKFYRKLGKRLRVPVLFEPYHKPELSKRVAGALQLDGHYETDWNWDLCLRRMRNGVRGYDRKSLARLWYLWLKMPHHERNNPNVNAMMQQALTEAMACGIRNVGLKLAHVQRGTGFLLPTLKWLEDLRLPF